MVGHLAPVWILRRHLLSCDEGLTYEQNLGVFPVPDNQAPSVRSHPSDHDKPKARDRYKGGGDDERVTTFLWVVNRWELCDRVVFTVRQFSQMDSNPPLSSVSAN